MKIYEYQQETQPMSHVARAANEMAVKGWKLHSVLSNAGLTCLLVYQRSFERTEQEAEGIRQSRNA